MPKTDTAIALILESHRTELLDHVNKTIDALKAQLVDDAAALPKNDKVPTLEQCQDPANKDGANLTPRGVELLYRLFDDGAGYNRASKALGITQTAARNRKGLWEKKEGGLNRERKFLEGIDS
ncbi:MAG: hypothetical protein Q7J26_02620 [Brevundimonas sp.]|uniref:hypothetical protein n=1 Tax=Brevundimonas sp. TaxID=1871086 RepID=UPI0027195D77|nr:hypothetical protein [Brevundimonas sp.]MDO9607393.1 hypothetical protein [Brevundimonas sp.]